METTVAPRIAAEQARSWLLVPAGKPEGFEAAHASAADAVILDLEDAVTTRPQTPGAAPTSSPGSASTGARGCGSTTPPHPTGRTTWQRSNGVPGSGRHARQDRERNAGRRHRRAAPRGHEVLALVESAMGLEARTRDRPDGGHVPARVRQRRLPPRHRDGRFAAGDGLPPLPARRSPAGRPGSHRRSTAPPSAPTSTPWSGTRR